MIRFPRQISSEFFKYTYTGSMEDLRNKLENLTKRTNGFSAYPHLLVKPTGDNEFTVIIKFEPATFKRNPFDTGTSVKGYYFKTKSNTTQVNLLVAPHFMFPILFLLLPIFIMLIFFTGFSDKTNFPAAYLLTAFWMIAAPVAVLFISASSKKRLLERLVNYMQLTKIL
jgi:hypothetical protein